MSKAPPRGWCNTTLGKLGDWTSGGTPSRMHTEYYGDGLPWVKTGDLTDGPLLEVPESITALGLKNSAAKRLPKGTLLIAMYGATIGKLGLLTFDAATNQACAALLPNGQTADFIPYVFHYLRGQREELRRIGQGGAQPNISQALIKEYPIALPPLNEQRRIVAKLESLQARSRRAREALDAVPPLLEKLRQSILAAAFRGDLTKDWRAKHKDVEPAEKLLARIRVERRKKWEEAEVAKMKAKGKTPTDDKWKAKYKEPEPVDGTGLPVLPKGWCWASVEECSVLVTDGDHNPPKRVPDGVPHLTAKNIKHRQVRFEGCSFVTEAGFEQTRQRYEALEGDVIITCVGTLGETAIVPAGIRFSADRNLAAVRLVGNGITAELFQHWLNTVWVQQHLGIVSGSTAQPHLYLNDLRALAVPVVPASEQAALVDAIAEGLTRVQTAAGAGKEATQKLDVLQRASLAKAFRGELVPQDPSDEPAAAVLARAEAESRADMPRRRNGRK